jgi:lysophospholipase L1-like esterase
VNRWLVGVALAAGVALATHGWLAVAPLSFHAGLLLCAGGFGGLSVFAARRRRSAAVFLQNTLACLLVGIVLVDRGILSREWAEGDELVSYSFVEAQGRPEAFVRWRERNLREKRRTKGNSIPDPRGVNPRVPKPGSTGTYFDSTWRINTLGFRGPEISREKGDRYRIVALGESTTFGATLRSGDRPWPEVLEERIAAEFACEKPVQVVNAGKPGWSLANNLAVLDSDIFPLDPDLIISYHGYNGFYYLLSEIPSVSVGRVPSAPPRPSLFLARIESAARVAWFKRRYRAARSIDAKVLEMDVHLTRYADLYRKLVFASRVRDIDVALCTFNMAVTPNSPDEVIRFYEPVFPDLRAQILANRLHTLLVHQIAETHDVLAIDTSPGLDGAYEDAFVDVIHFTQTGRDRLAERVLEGIREILARPSPGCRPRSKSG